ncbi:hypothetical protein [Haliangium ochraceum]|uniref:Two component regulator propeller domain protein n=1 Tax=Haliangium ochraceum (strain DSM 14365 / JCM 11303 / SMP-2) TaxID=502025 RepID=D0LJ28_HALO1|nr:hypothetical protein [Haliangium ochraceum]ACY14875.1 hypothetical protein Hoch_2333 [Haliangium ochraceum DSM 14365]
MNPRHAFLTALILPSALSALSALSAPTSAHATPAARAAESAPTAASAPAEAAPGAAPRVSAVFTHTREVEDIAVDGNAVWVATRGGLERYALPGGRRERLYTNLDGLSEIHVREVHALAGQVTLRTQEHRCELRGDRFECVAAPPLPTPEPALSQRFQGARVSARADIFGGELIGTAGRGLWLRWDRAPDAPLALTPRGQVCSNHMMATAEFRGRLYLGSFDEGVCMLRERGDFVALRTPFRMVNDMVATADALYVAANSGLYRSADGVGFERIEFVSSSGVNGLAVDGDVLYATTPSALWRVPLAARDASGRRLRPASYWLPGGSRAMQKVSVGAGAVWMASEDRGVIRFAEGRFEVFDRAAGMPTSWVMDVAVSDDTMHAVSFRHGLIAVPLDAASGAPRVEAARLVGELPDTWLLRARAVGDALWVGTQQGAARVSASGVETISEVPHPCVHAIASWAGATWLATEGGLVRVEG